MSQTTAGNQAMTDEKEQDTSEVSGPATVENSSPKERWSSIDNDKSDGHIFLLIFSLFLGVFVMALDQTIIGTAVPAITSEFNSLDDIAWYGSGYLLTITAFQPTFGKLYQFFRAKTVFMACVVVFEVGSILCAAAPTSDVFIAGRAIAGTGAAGLFQGSLAIITRTIRLEKRPLCISIVTSTFAVSVAIGPVIGGAFADRVTWRWCFWINVPIGAVGLILIYFLLHIPKDVQSTEFKSLSLSRRILKLDPVGAVLIIGAVVSILLALQWGGQSLPFNSSTVIGLLVGFGVLLITFFVIQYFRGDDATLPLRLLRQRSILSGAVFSLFFSMPSYVYGYYIPIYFQAVKETSATISGTRYLALVLPQLFGVVLTGALVTMFGVYTPYMIIGTAIAVVGSGLLLLFGLETTAAQWASFLVICGLGTGFSINLPYTIIQAVLEEDQAPMGNAAFQFMFQLGGALGLSISQTIFLNRLKSSAMDLTPSIPYSAIMQAGAHNLRGIAPTPEIYDNLRQAYNNALHDTYIYPVAVTGAALLACLGLEHKNIKHVEKGRAQAKLDKKEGDKIA